MDRYRICTDGTGACQHSYSHGKGLREGLNRWLGGVAAAQISGASYPGDTLTRDPGIKEVCQKIYLRRSAENEFCEACGAALAFDSLAPDLGACKGCHRTYSNVDLNATFCPTCGIVVEIEEAHKREIEAHVCKLEILGLIPDLKQFGYLSST